MKPPRFVARLSKGARPKFGIGILIGALLVLGSQMSGSDSAFAMVLGGGVGVAVGLTARSDHGKFAGKVSDEEEPGVKAP